MLINQYSTPARADFATLTGSPIWGYSVDEIIERAKVRGWTHRSSALAHALWPRRRWSTTLRRPAAAT
ncbi:MAG: hypothetical protein R2911_27370 [Caldilineaceae bacterium]